MTKKYSAEVAQKWLEDGLKEGSGPRRFAIDVQDDNWWASEEKTNEFDQITFSFGTDPLDFGYIKLPKQYGPYTLAVEVELDDEETDAK